MKSFRVLVVLGIILGMMMPSSAQEKSKDISRGLEKEFKWLREEAMVITVATKTKMNINDAPSIVSVITEDEIRNSGARNLEEVLRQVAGFNTYTFTTYPDVVVNIRWLGASTNPSVKILINGHSAENPLDGSAGMTISFPVNLIKKIEIIRGPGSALYGNAAMNGVVNIIAKDEKDPSAVSVTR